MLCLNPSEFTSPTSQLKGRDAAQLKFLQRSEEEIGDLFWTRLSRVCRDVPVGENFYLNWFLQGKRGCDPIVQPNYGPPCLTKEGFTKLKVTFYNLYVFEPQEYSRTSEERTFWEQAFCPLFRGSLIFPLHRLMRRKSLS